MNNQTGNHTVSPKTPYAFVPLSERVFFPNWSGRISHDVPFSDGICGTIRIRMTARTPVSVKDSTGDFCNVQGRYFIPGSSIKGAVRNVLSEMSFSKIGHVLDSTYGLRNVNDSEYRKNMHNIKCGWMCKEEDGVKIYSCGEPGRVSFETICKKFGKNGGYLRGRMAKDKYRFLLGDEMKFDRLRGKFDRVMDKGGSKDNRKKYRFSDSGKDGTIVLTGQINGSKKYDFVFIEPASPSIIPVTKASYEAFCSIHSNSEDFSSGDKPFWKPRLDSGQKIPVFFKLNDDGSIHSIGLSYMYKYPFKHSVSDNLPPDHKSRRPDLSECIFGYTGDDQSVEALKGRVQFGHAFTGFAGRPDSETVTLSSPRSSFYPFYLQGGVDWNRDNARIAGFKRYPVRGKVNRDGNRQLNNSRVNSTLSLLPADTVFEGTISFHNLRPIELGALLSALTFHGNERSCYHSIGGGKPLGYGKMSVSVVSLDGKTVSGDNIGSSDLQRFMAGYEDCMDVFCNKVIQKPWLESDQMVQLYLMARGIPDDKAWAFEYMPLQDFRIIKNGHKALWPFSRRIGSGITSVPSIKAKR
ncbi:MAG: TIGR03986 family CRISPR-associated RAMP protein [Bacteroidales bacterium]|nr:TIGR03986 family CRISPR-associated RAMP protein [Bacteroidales bacterium]